MSGQLVQWKSSPDRVIQNTPTRTSHSPSHSPSIESDMNEMNVSYDTPEIQAATTNSIEGSPQSNPNPVKFMNANDIFQKPLRLLDESPQHDEELNIEVGDGDRPNTNILRNERTPDLDRISNFFKNNRTPGKENLLTKYESSGLEDTPLSSRKKLTFHNSNNLLEPQISERLKSNTEFCSYKESNDGENNTSLEVTEADATFLQAAELSADNYNCLAEEATTRKKYKADSSLTESIQDRDVQKTEIVASAESPNSIISSLGKNGTSKDGWTMRRISEAFENNEDEIKIFGEGGAMRSNSEYHSTNDSKEESSQIIRGSELKAENNEMGKNLNVPSQKNMNNSYTNIEKSATCGTPSNNNVVQETPLIDSRSNRTPSKRWVFRYSRDETEFNSNRSTQIVNNPRTQEMALDNFPINTQSLSKSYNIDTNNELETQIIVSSLSQGISAQKGPDFQSTGQTEEIKTQIINSPEHNTLNVTLQTPGNISRISFEPILEVPETSSPSKNALSKPSNSSPIPKEKDAFNVYEKEIETNNVFSNDMQRSLNADSGDHAMLDGSSDFYEQKEIADRVFLQLSGKQKSDLGNDKAEFPSQNELDVKREGTIMSEAELTQELPEVEEQQGLDTSPKTLANEKLVTTERPKGKETSLQIDADNTDCNPDEQDDAELPPKTFTGQEAGEKNSQFQKKSIRLFQNESQEIVQNRRTIKRRQKDTIEIGEEEENRSTKTSPSKRLKRSTDSEPTSVKREGSSSISLQAGIEEGDEDFRKKTYAFPEGIRVEDSSFLSKDDITNGNAVWCQYSWNYKFYPGILLDIDTNQDSCWIYFESGKSLTKEEDIYYLDIRIGDAVIFDGNEYIVVGLECRSHDPNIIRCIRGYDTVYMKKKNLSGSLGKRTLIKALSSISLDLNEWTKRAKIIMEDNERTKGNAYRYLRHPIRGRKSMTNVLSPKKLTDDEKGMRKHTRMHINDQELRYDNKETIKKSIKDLSSSLGGSPSQLFSSGEIKKGNIFDGCIFVLTSLFENREELHQVIESQGGTVIESGFSVLFDFPHPPSKSLLLKSSPKNIHELDLKLAWKPDCLFTDYRFACLITKRHLRSLKYLETLTLGWPTLHWKFISACIEEKRILPRLIHQYLLPSGESFRLSSDSQSKGGIIKSNNIFSFYTKFLQGSNLKDQMHKVKNMLNDYIIIKCGSSELDSFIKFAFACLGANRMFEIDLPSIEVENTEPLLNILGPLILQIGSTLSDENLKFLIYVNESNGKSQMRLLEKLRSQLSVNFDHLEYIFHTESKEWLIQTIINENTGFRDTVRDDDRCDTIPDADYTDRNI